MNEAAIEALALYFTGPCVGLHSVGLVLSGEQRIAATSFYAARAALGVQGYASKDEAVAAIRRALDASRP